MNKFKDWQSSYQKIWVKRDHHLTAKHPRILVRKPSAEREERVNCAAHIQRCLKNHTSTLTKEEDVAVEGLNKETAREKTLSMF